MSAHTVNICTWTRGGIAIPLGEDIGFLDMFQDHVNGTYELWLSSATYMGLLTVHTATFYVGTGNSV